jgi:hypothetical protein
VRGRRAYSLVTRGVRAERNRRAGGVPTAAPPTTDAVAYGRLWLGVLCCVGTPAVCARSAWSGLDQMAVDEAGGLPRPYVLGQGEGGAAGVSAAVQGDIPY